MSGINDIKEINVSPLQTDLSIYSKFNFENQPVGIKFLLNRPKGIEQLDKSMAFCEMIKEAQQSGTPFYITKENEDCAGKLMLGMEDPSPIGESGQLGIKFGIFQEPRANSRLLKDSPKIAMGTVNYVAFSTLDKLAFEPDLFLLMATPSQAEIVLRAMSYSTGEMWSSKVTPVGACAWLFIYPYQSGNVNYVATGMTFGMKARKVYPEGWMLISIPYTWIPVITQNLQQMEWVLPSYTESREQFLIRHDRVMKELVEEFQNTSGQ